MTSLIALDIAVSVNVPAYPARAPKPATEPLSREASPEPEAEKKA